MIGFTIGYNILSVSFLIVIFTTYVTSVRIGSFNLHQYGTKKANNATVTDLVAKILNDFDLAVIQEITDVNQQAPYVLYDALNKVSKSGAYGMSMSERVGRSSSKEQYIFFNREATSNLQLVQAYLYTDADDHFERPPFIGTFKVKTVGSSRIKFFTIMDVHLRPDAAYLEFLHMRLVIRDFIVRNPQYFTQTSSSLAEAIAANVIDATASNKPHLKTDHPILIMGDFNADCSYISASRQETLRSINFADFVWMIENTVKTNTRQTCTYDRILINGADFVKSIIRNSNTTVNFQQRFGMTLDQALGISDHFPVKFDINW